MPSVTSGRSSSAGDLPGLGEHVPRSGPRRSDQVVGREDGHHLVVRAVDRERGQRDGRGGVASRRLEDDPGIRHLGPDEVGVGGTDDDPDAGQARHQPQPVDRPLDERPLVEQRQEGLRAIRAAERAQPGAAPARKDHRVHPRIVEHEPSSPTGVTSGEPSNPRAEDP